jgi:hypothetical protein
MISPFKHCPCVPTSWPTYRLLTILTYHVEHNRQISFVLTARIVLDNPQSGKQEAPSDEPGAFAFLELTTGQKEGRPGIRAALVSYAARIHSIPF